VKRLAVLSLVSFFACDDSLSSSPSTFRSATTELPMLRIVSAELAADGTTDVTLGWTLPDDPNITSVRLERREGPEEPWSPLVEVPAATSPLFTDAAVPGLRAEYRVVAWAGETEQSASSVRTVTSIAGTEYDLPEVTVPGVPFSTSLFGVVRYPQEPSTAPRPLVVFLHGNHGNCRNPATLEDECAEQTTHECTVEGYDTAPNAHGYVYLQETLAAQGYVTVSLGANALNCRGGGNNWIDERTALILEHLRRWSAWSASGEGPLGSEVVGAADLSRVVLVGHSRGGEAVSRAPSALQSAPIPGVSLAGVFALAPTDFTSPSPTGMPFATLLPGCDADVSSLDGLRHYDRGLQPPTPDSRTQVLFVGANHNGFNTEWLVDDNVEAGEFRVCSDEQWVGAPAQRGMFEIFLSDWIDAVIQQAPLPAYMRADEEIPAVVEAWSGGDLDLRWSYASPERQAIDDFETYGDPDFNTTGGPNTYTNVLDMLWSRSTPSNNRPAQHVAPTLRAEWEGSASATFDLDPVDATDFAHLSVRFTSSNSARNTDTVEHDFTILVRDTADEVAAVSISEVGRLPHVYPAVVRPRTVLSTIRIPIAELVARSPDFDPSQIAQVAFVWPGDGPATGSVWMANLELAD